MLSLKKALIFEHITYHTISIFRLVVIMTFDFVEHSTRELYWIICFLNCLYFCTNYISKKESFEGRPFKNLNNDLFELFELDDYTKYFAVERYETACNAQGNIFSRIVNIDSFSRLLNFVTQLSCLPNNNHSLGLV